MLKRGLASNVKLGVLLFTLPTFRLTKVSLSDFDWLLILRHAGGFVPVQVALEYLLRGPVSSGEQVTAEIKAKLSDEHVKVNRT